MMSQIKQIFFHIALICGLVCLSAKILDWYNPFMDFSGHVAFLGVSGCAAVLILWILHITEIYRRNLEARRRGFHGNAVYKHKHYHQAV